MREAKTTARNGNQYMLSIFFWLEVGEKRRRERGGGERQRARERTSEGDVCKRERERGASRGMKRKGEREKGREKKRDN